MSAPVKERAGIYGPPGFPLGEYLGKLNHSGLATSSAYRRAIAQSSPLMFALIYMSSKHLRSPDGLLSFSEMHVDLAEMAKIWMCSDLRPREVRKAVAAPRKSGKSTWLFLILPIWALAFGHRNFIVAFADTSEMAQRHLETLTQELETNRLLRLDFPELCTPVVKRASLYRARSGAAMMALGAKTGSLGVKLDERRPDLLLIDDIEPKAEDYSPKLKDKRLKTLREAIFPMNDRAVVMIAGTVVMAGSIIDDILKGADWVGEERIDSVYFPAIVENPDGSERSLWPQQWELEDLRDVRHQATFQLNMMNKPANPDGSFWKSTDFSYDVPRDLTTRILAIDPAVTTTERSDFTGLAVVAYSPSARRAVVEMSAGVRLTNAELRSRVHQLCAANPSITHVLIEVNQGRDVWETILQPLPRGVKLEKVGSSVSKANRFKLVHDFYERGWVAHTKPFPDLEEQACSFPHTQFDDVLDAACLGVHWWLKDRPRPLVGVA